MGDVAVDTAELVAVRAGLEALAARLEAAGARLAAGDAMALGGRTAVAALERAQEDWQLHVASLRLLADVAARDLGRAATAYDECEAASRALVAGAAGAVAAQGPGPATDAVEPAVPLGPPVPAGLPLLPDPLLPDPLLVGPGLPVAGR